MPLTITRRMIEEQYVRVCCGFFIFLPHLLAAVIEIEIVIDP